MAATSNPHPNITGDQAEAGRFSLMELRRLHNILIQNKNVSDANQDLVVEVLRILAEMVVYGDNKSELLFDFFCEKNMLSLFLEIMRVVGPNGANSCPSAVHVQILQTLSILINCVKNDTSLYYLLSNNYVNDIIVFPHDFESDESLRDQFVSFMKSLSLRLNRQTVQFFFIEDNGAFPILTRAIELLSLPDSMCRIAAQSTILNVFGVFDKRAREYALQDEMVNKMFAAVVFFMHSQYDKISSACMAYVMGTCSDSDESSLIQIENRLDDLMVTTEDWLYYLQDLMDLKIPKITESLIFYVINDFLYKCLLNPSVEEYYYDEALGNVELALIRGMNKLSSFVFIVQMIRVITDPLVHNAMLIALFHPLNQYCRQCLLNYISLTVNGQIDTTKPISHSEDTPDERETTNVIISSLIGEVLEKVDESSSRPLSEPVAVALDESNGRCSIASNKIDSSDENLYRRLLADSLDKTNMKMTTVSLSILQLLISELITSASAGTSQPSNGPSAVSISAAESASAAAAAAAPSSAASVADDILNEEILDSASPPERGSRVDEAMMKEITRIQMNTWRQRKCNISKPSEAADILESLFILPNKLSLTTSEREARLHERFFPPSNRNSDAEFAGDGKSRKRGSSRSSSSSFSNKAGKGVPFSSSVSQGSSSFDLDPELMSLSLVVEIGQIIKTNETSLSICPYVQHLFKLLLEASTFSLTNIQASVNIIFSLFGLLQMAILSDDDIKDERRESLRESCRYIMEETGSCCKAAAASLIVRTKGSHAELLLKMLQEEKLRSKGRKWATVMKRINKDILLLLPSSSSNTERLGVDFEIPNKMTEIIRKEIEVFLLLKVFYEHCKEKIQGWNEPSSVNTAIGNIDELYGAILNSDIISLEENALIPPHISEGSIFDMRGKRFLDATLVPNKHGINDLSSSSSTVLPSYSSPSTSLSWGLSWYIGGSNAKRSSTSNSTTSSPVHREISPVRVPSSSRSPIPSTTTISSAGPSKPESGTTKRILAGLSYNKNKSAAAAAEAHSNPPVPAPVLTVQQKHAVQYGLLFVQDPTLFIVVSQDKTDAKTVFNVYAATPLLYSFATKDKEDKRSFQLLVRSSRELQNMERVGFLTPEKIAKMGVENPYLNTLIAEEDCYPVFPESIAGAAAATAAESNILRSYLRGPRRSIFWQLTVMMETEEACSLAVKYIETKRQELYNGKLSELNDMLQKWENFPNGF